MMAFLIGAIELWGDVGGAWWLPSAGGGPYLLLDGTLGAEDRNFGVSVRYFDISQGSEAPYEARAYLSSGYLVLGPLLVGRAPVGWGWGLVLGDLGMGTDQLRLRLGGVELLGALLSDSVLLASRITARPFEVYGMATEEVRWVGAHLEGRYLVAEGGLRLDTLVSGAGFIRLRWQGLRAGYFYFHPGWRTPLPYPMVLDDYYNGWTPFGEAMCWSGMLWDSLASLLSDGPMGPWGIYWPHMHRLEAVNLAGELGREGITARLDLYGYRVLGVGPLGWELAGLLRRGENPSLGLAGGVLLTGWTQSPIWALRLWWWYSFRE